MPGTGLPRRRKAQGQGVLVMRVVVGMYRIVRPPRRVLEVFGFEPWMRLGWCTDIPPALTMRSTALDSSTSSVSMLELSTLGISVLRFISWRGRVCVLGMTRIQPFSGVESSTANQMVTTSIGSRGQ